MNDDHYETISRKLDILVRLAALSLIADKPQQERMIMLSTAGFQPKEIADICGTTSNTVRVSLSTMRKKGKGKQSKTKVSKKLTNSLDIE